MQGGSDLQKGDIAHDEQIDITCRALRPGRERTVNECDRNRRPMRLKARADFVKKSSALAQQAPQFRQKGVRGIGFVIHFAAPLRCKENAAACHGLERTQETGGRDPDSSRQLSAKERTWVADEELGQDELAEKGDDGVE
jgi:hypothetical protein